MEVELERTYLVRMVPEELREVEPVEIWDIYFPLEHPHPTLRARKRGERYEMTKKSCLNERDSSEQREDTIKLSAEEFQALAKAPGKQARKRRYSYRQEKVIVEIDVYLDDLAGLVLADFEFESKLEKDAFKAPEWCLAEVTQDEALAGGKLAGKKYEELAEVLAGYGYEARC